MKRALLVALAVVAGCSKKPAAKPPTCDEMGAAIVEHFTAALKPEEGEDARQMAKRMAAMLSQRMVQHCKSDVWSPELIECATRGEMAACSSLFTTDQKQKLDADMLPVKN